MAAEATARSGRRRSLLIIGDYSDFDGMRATADFDVLNDAEALGIDDADAVRQAVGSEDALAIRRDGDAPRTAAHVLGDRGDQLVLGDADDVDRVGSAARNVQAVPGGGDRHLDGTGVQAEGDGVHDFLQFGVDDADGATDLGRHVSPGAVGREADLTRTVAYEQVFDRFEVLNVEDGGRMGGFCGQVHVTAIGAYCHAFGLDAGTEGGDLFTGLGVVPSTLGDRLKGCPHLGAIGAHEQAFRVAAGTDFKRHFASLHIDGDQLVFGRLEHREEVTDRDVDD